MIKVMYWSVKKQKIIILLFMSMQEALFYLDNHFEDIELNDHFVKILSEVNN